MRVTQDVTATSTVDDRCHADPIPLLLADALACLAADRPAASRHIARAWALLQHEDAAAKRVACALTGGQIKRLQDYIDAHLDRAIRCAELAAALNLSVSHFSHVCKSTFGMTPLAYVSSRRIQAACQRMLTTDSTLTTIAIGHGFCDQSHFIRTFRRHIGIPPQAWRRLRETTQGDAAPPGIAGDIEIGSERKLISVPIQRRNDHVNHC